MHRDEVFVAGGQPTVTYVKREELHVERQLARAIATPNQIVSLSGPTKTGKTVLCRKVLGDREYVWIDGGQVKDAGAFWDRVCSELNLALEIDNSVETETSGSVGVDTFVSASGSRLSRKGKSEKVLLSNMGSALSKMVAERIILVIDDFHYIPSEERTILMRNIKGAVFNGLKVLLLSVTHRSFDAIKAETELTGRFVAIDLPAWSQDDLRAIPNLGFSALKVKCSQDVIDRIAEEAQQSPFLMQKFCWELCYDSEIEWTTTLLGRQSVPEDYDLSAMFVRLAQDAGLPIYQSLAAGPISRKVRMKRPLATGEEADIYEATLLAIAETGPAPVISYEELRTSLNKVLTDRMPQKHEITSALKHLSVISVKRNTAIDWDEESREINVTDPYLRFYLRWQVRRHL